MIALQEIKIQLNPEQVYGLSNIEKWWNAVYHQVNFKKKA